MASELKYAPIYFDNIELLEMLPDEERGKLFMALLAFSAACAKGEDENVDISALDLASKVAYKSMTKEIRRCYEVLQTKSKNGSKGGRPQKEETDENQTKADETEINRNKADETEINRNGEYKENNKDELKKREIKDEDYIITFCAESSSAPVIGIPLNDGSEFWVTEDMVDNWKSLYPSVDVDQELRNMVGWCQGNPTRRKTKRGVLKFVNSWLAKEQDRGGKQRVAPKKRSWIDVGDELEAEYDVKRDE